jgi:predicted DNA-binding ribbon-helix-helix protein
MTSQDNGLFTGHAAPFAICRNVTVAGRRTSVRIEVEFWEGLTEICAREQIGLAEICTRVEAARRGTGLAGALRVFILCYFRELSRRQVPVQPRAVPPAQTPTGLVAAALDGVGGREAQQAMRMEAATA